MTVAKLAPLKSEVSAGRQIEELIQQWKESGQLADIESSSLSTLPSQTRSITELSEYLTRSSANRILRRLKVISFMFKLLKHTASIPGYILLPTTSHMIDSCGMLINLEIMAALSTARRLRKSSTNL